MKCLFVTTLLIGLCACQHNAKPQTLDSSAKQIHHETPVESLMADFAHRY